MLARLLGTLALVLAVLAPTSAVAADGLNLAVAPGASFTFVGDGSGHGVGMSQWGARGRALAGQNTTQILAAYYLGATLTVQGDDREPIRVNVGGKVKTLALHDYLASVVASEMPKDFPTAALAAQAIASRTFALWSRDPTKPYDVAGDVSSQAFGAAARPDAIAAVDATRGQVLTYDGKVIAAYFHACSPVETEDNDHVWAGPPLPYLRGIQDWDAAGHPYAADCPRAQWQAGPFSAADFTRLLSADPRTAVGAVSALQFKQRSPSGRWETVTISGAAGAKTVSLAVFRAVMNAGATSGHILYSADFTLGGQPAGPIPVAPPPDAGPGHVISYIL